MAIIWVGTGRFNAYIGPVQDYIDRVVAADVAAGNTLGLEVGVRDAYDVFIRDSINVGDLGASGGVLSQANSIIKAAPIMAGARTLAGALVPLVGAAPTRFGAAGGWNYNRRTGLAGNGTDNYLDSNRNNSADPRNSSHNAVYITTPHTGAANGVYIGSSNAPGSNNIGQSPSPFVFFRNRTLAALDVNGVPINFLGTSRGSSSSYTARMNGNNTTVNLASDGLYNESVHIFARAAQSLVNARIAFYSIGGFLDLALLDPRVTTLINAIAAAIP